MLLQARFGSELSEAVTSTETMKTIETLRTKKIEATFSALVPLFILLILPYWGATAMVVGSAIGMVALTWLYKESMCESRGFFTTTLCVTGVVVVSAGIAVAKSLIRGHWY